MGDADGEVKRRPRDVGERWCLAVTDEGVESQVLAGDWVCTTRVMHHESHWHGVFLETYNANIKRSESMQEEEQMRLKCKSKRGFLVGFTSKIPTPPRRGKV